MLFSKNDRTTHLELVSDVSEKARRILDQARGNRSNPDTRSPEIIEWTRALKKAQETAYYLETNKGSALSDPIVSVFLNLQFRLLLLLSKNHPSQN